MKLGLQIYTLRNSLLKDPAGHFERIREMGYEGVELVDFGGDTVERFADLIEKNGMELFSIHTDHEKVTAGDRTFISRAEALGIKYMPISWMPEEKIPGGALYPDTVEAIKRYSEYAAQKDIRILYHNHDFEMEFSDGKRKLDSLYNDLPAESLGAELDTCWIYSGGGDVMEYYRTYGPRTPVLHIKDCIKEGGRKGFMVPGEGVIDFVPIIDHAKKLDLPWLCVEQDEPSPGKTAEQCAKEAAAYLRNLM